MAVNGHGAGTGLATLARALGSPVRLAIVRYLQAQKGACTCGAIVDQLPLAQSTVSRHLEVLVGAGLVQRAAEPPRVLYRVDRGTLAEFKRLAAAL